jgi:hypothetical protein
MSRKFYQLCKQCNNANKDLQYVHDSEQLYQKIYHISHFAVRKRIVSLLSSSDTEEDDSLLVSQAVKKKRAFLSSSSDDLKEEAAKKEDKALEEKTAKLNISKG